MGDGPMNGRNGNVQSENGRAKKDAVNNEEDVQQHVRVCVSEDGEPVLLPLESDGTLLLSTVTAKFPQVTSLKYLNPEGKGYRILRLMDGRFYSPQEKEDKWLDTKFYCVFPKDVKRQQETESCEDRNSPKSDKSSSQECNSGNTSSRQVSPPQHRQREWNSGLVLKSNSHNTPTDLIVLGLSSATTDEALRNYFLQFGEVVMAQVKRVPHTQESRGFGFIRFGDYTAQEGVLKMLHPIDDRMCRVRVPNSKFEAEKQEMDHKIHVRGTTENMTIPLLRDFFSHYGIVEDVFVPRPFRNFAFVTFRHTESAGKLIGREMVIQGTRVTIGSAAPKMSGYSGFGGRPWHSNGPLLAANSNSYQQQQHHVPAVQSHAPLIPCAHPMTDCQQSNMAALYAAYLCATGMATPSAVTAVTSATDVAYGNHPCLTSLPPHQPSAPFDVTQCPPPSAIPHGNIFAWTMSPPPAPPHHQNMTSMAVNYPPPHFYAAASPNVASAMAAYASTANQLFSHVDQGFHQQVASESPYSALVPEMYYPVSTPPVPSTPTTGMGANYLFSSGTPAAAPVMSSASSQPPPPQPLLDNLLVSMVYGNSGLNLNGVNLSPREADLHAGGNIAGAGTPSLYSMATLTPALNSALAGAN